METTRLIEELSAHGAALGDAAERAGLDAAVPGCPGWAVRDLLAHVGTVHRWAAGIVRNEDGAAQHTDFPAPADGVLEWFRDGHLALVEILSAAPADLEAWTFLPAPTPLAFWARRQAHETAIHRADAEAAAGSSVSFEADFASDGLAELLEGFLGRPRGRLTASPGFVLHVAPSEGTTSWSIAVGPELRTVTRHDDVVDVPADCTVRGSLSDLYLDLWNRAPTRTVTIEGDPAPMQTWRRLATVNWN